MVTAVLDMARCHFMKNCQKVLRLVAPFQNVGKDLNDLKSFVIRYIYGDTQSSTLNQAHATKWKSLKKKSSMRLLPDDDSLEQHINDSLEQHIKCANFLAYIQHHPDLRRHPFPIGRGWELVNGYCRPVHHTKPALSSLLPVSPTQQDQYNSNSEAN